MIERFYSRRCSAPRLRDSAQDPASQASRRREAAWRSVPLDCGCRDGRTCKCTEPPLSARAIDGWRDAALYLLEHSGKTPLLPVEVLQALWRRGGADRALAEQLHALTNGEVA